MRKLPKIRKRILQFGGGNRKQRGVLLPWGPIISPAVNVAPRPFGKGIRKRTRRGKSKKSSAFLEKKII